MYRTTNQHGPGGNISVPTDSLRSFWRQRKDMKEVQLRLLCWRFWWWFVEAEGQKLSLLKSNSRSKYLSGTNLQGHSKESDLPSIRIYIMVKITRLLKQKWLGSQINCHLGRKGHRLVRQRFAFHQCCIEGSFLVSNLYLFGVFPVCLFSYMPLSEDKNEHFTGKMRTFWLVHLIFNGPFKGLELCLKLMLELGLG